MKHSIPLLIKLLLLVAILFQSCDNDSNTVTNEKYSLKKINQHEIPIADAIEMHNEYESNRIQLLEKKLGTLYKNPEFEDTKFVWMPLEDLKAYVNYVEDIKRTNPNDEVSGIRLYFSAYPNKKQFDYSNKKITDPGQQTIFMVPTVKLDNKNEEHKIMNHLPFAIKYENKSNLIKGSFKILDTLMLNYYKGQERRDNYYEKSKQTRQQKASTLSSSLSFRQDEYKGLKSVIYNEFQLAPPPKKGDN